MYEKKYNEKNVVLRFCVFDETYNFKICDVITDITTH